jgi:hypothetical protein
MYTSNRLGQSVYVSLVDFRMQLDELLQRYIFLIPSVRLHANRVTLDEVKARIPILIAVYAENWPHIQDSVVAWCGFTSGGKPLMDVSLEEESSKHHVEEQRFTVEARRAARRRMAWE